MPAESRLFGYTRGLLAFTAACLPLYAVRWQVGPFPTTLLENLILATIALYLIACWREGGLRFNRSPLDIAILVLLLSGAVSVLVAKDHRAALGLYRAYFIEPIAIFYVAGDLLRRGSHFRTLLVGFGAGTSLFAILNIGWFLVALINGTIAYGAPPSAIYTSSNEVAMFLEPPMAFASALYLFSHDRRDRRWARVWGVILAPALVLTFSRGAFLALAVLAVLTIVTVRPGLRRPLLLLAAVTIALALITVVVASSTPLMQTRFSYVALNYTLQTRSEIYVATFHMLSAHPILGVGLGGYVYVLHGFPEIYPHDLYLAFWVELGLIGLLAFGYILVKLLVGAWRALGLAAGFQKALLWAVIGALVLWAVHGVFDSPYWKNDMSTEFWMIAAVQLAAVRAVREGRTSIEAPPGAGSPLKAT